MGRRKLEDLVFTDMHVRRGDRDICVRYGQEVWYGRGAHGYRASIRGAATGRGCQEATHLSAEDP